MNDFIEYKLEKVGCWQKARQYRVELFQTVIKFPITGQSLRNQIIRAVSSIGHNIAEGYGRASFKENIQFCRIARGSLCEVRDQLYTAFDFGFLTKDLFDELYNKNLDLERNLNGYIGFLKKQMVKYKS
jgi:four helix bundle protein